MAISLLVVLWQLDGLLSELHIPRDPAQGMGSLNNQGVEAGWQAFYTQHVELGAQPGHVAVTYLVLDCVLVPVYTTLLAFLAVAIAAGVPAQRNPAADDEAKALRFILAAALLLTPVLAVVDLLEDLFQGLVLATDEPQPPLPFLTGAKWVLLALVALSIVLGAIHVARGNRRAIRNGMRTLAAVRFQLVAVAGLALLLFGPITGPQAADAILRFEGDRTDGLAAVGLTVLLALTVFVTARRCAEIEEESTRTPISPPVLALLGVIALVGAAYLHVHEEGGEGFLVLGMILVGLAVLSALLPIKAHGLTGMPRRGTVLVPALLGAAPLLLLGLAILSATSGQLALHRLSDASAWERWALVGALLALAALATFVLSHGPLGELLTRRPIRRGIFLLGALVAGAITLAIYVNPWTAGAIVGTIGATATFLVWVALGGRLIIAIERRREPPSALVLMHFHRIPILLLVVIVAVGSALFDKVGDHQVRTLDTPHLPKVPVLAETFQRWERHGLFEQGHESNRKAVPLVFVAASGGGIRAAYWTARVLGCAFEGQGPAACPHGKDMSDPPTRQPIFAASGASGGSLGLATYMAHVAHPDALDDWVRRGLDDDYLAPTLAWLLFADLPKAVLAIHGGQDRAEVLERAWEQSWGNRKTLPHQGPTSAGPLADGLRSSWDKNEHAPLLVLNGTSVHDDCRVAVSVVDADVEERPRQVAGTASSPSTAECRSQRSFEGEPTRGEESRRDTWTLPATHDMVDYLGCSGRTDLRLSTAALLSARFPFVTPSGRVSDCHDNNEINVVDGGYLDNSGAWTVVDLWRKLRHSIEEHNRRSDTCIVPMFLQIDNDYAREANTAPRRRPAELLVPLQVFSKVRRGNEANARQEAALIFDSPGFGSVPRVTGSQTPLRRYAHIYPRAQPGTKAPLGWVLSDLAMEGLDKQLEDNHTAIKTVRSWFDAELRCDP